MSVNETDNEPERRTDFIREAINADNAAGRFGGRVHTRFPPEPNGFMHIGHAKAILVSYTVARDYNGKFNWRFDDTNPVSEDDMFVQQMLADARWLGVNWDDRLFYASDYFGRMFDLAIELIKMGKAYVDDLPADQISEYRGTLTAPGKDSPFRNRSIEENLDLFARMQAGEFPDGARTLRAKIDMAHPHLIMRDPVIYRILKTPHHRQGSKWRVYPMYDWAHGLEDSFEGITHSLCSLEFENHRPLYDWFLDSLGIYHPRQIEFARLNLSYTVMSKRKLKQLVEEKIVCGWDDPRLPTIAALRRRGYPPEALYLFCERIGVAKHNSLIAIELLEHCVRETLNKTAPRYMAVLDPVKVVIDNYPDGQIEMLEAVNNPEDLSAGTHSVPFSKTLYVEREDFMEVPAKKFWRLSPGNEVRLRYAYLITCKSVVKNDAGVVTEIHCAYDPATRGGDAPDGRKVKATLHWVSAEQAVDAEVRMYDKLFTVETPDADASVDFKTLINPDSLKVMTDCKMEPAAANLSPLTTVQFERKGYFCVDPDTKDGRRVFNLTVSLKDSWAKIQKQS